MHNKMSGPAQGQATTSGAPNLTIAQFLHAKPKWRPAKLPEPLARVQAEKKLKEAEERHRKANAYLRALENVLDVCERGSKVLAGKGTLAIPDLRRVYRRGASVTESAMGVEGGKLDREGLLRLVSNAFWFDFRKLPRDSRGEMHIFGKELFDQGVIKLPFAECVFVFACGSMDVAVPLRQTGDALEWRPWLAAPTHGNPIVIGADDPNGYALEREVFYALAVLNTKYFARTPHRMESSAKGVVGKPKPEDTYFCLTLRPEYEALATGNGTGQPRRLHWRRGHIRHIRNGKKTWIRATLVGADKTGVVVKDYRYAAGARHD